MRHRVKRNKAIERELAQDDGDVKSRDIEREDGLFGEFFVGVENAGDENDDDTEPEV